MPDYIGLSIRVDMDNAKVTLFFGYYPFYEMSLMEYYEMFAPNYDA